MRLGVLMALSAALAGAAFAQPAPRVLIEDDVAPATALKCTALRMAQADIAKRSGAADALVAASLDAWLKSGVDPDRAKQEAGKFASAAPAAIAAASEECATFEIRQVTPSGS